MPELIAIRGSSSSPSALWSYPRGALSETNDPNVRLAERTVGVDWRVSTADIDSIVAAAGVTVPPASVSGLDLFPDLRKTIDSIRGGHLLMMDAALLALAERAIANLEFRRAEDVDTWANNITSEAADAVD